MSANHARLLAWVADTRPTVVLTAFPQARYPRTVTPVVCDTLSAGLPEGVPGALPVGLAAELLACGAEAVFVDGFSPTPLSRPWAGPTPRWRAAEAFALDSPPVSRRALLGLGMNRRLPVDPLAPEAERYAQALRHLREIGRISPDGYAALVAVRDHPTAGVRDHGTADRKPAAAEQPPADREPDAPEVTARALTAHGCVACGVCVKACPSAALTLQIAESTATLTHDRARCTGEAACASLCPYQALESAPLTFADLVAFPTVDLFVGTARRCPKCSATYAGEGNLCPTCSRQQRDPFSSWLPPGFTPRAHR